MSYKPIESLICHLSAIFGSVVEPVSPAVVLVTYRKLTFKTVCERKVELCKESPDVTVIINFETWRQEVEQTRFYQFHNL